MRWFGLAPVVAACTSQAVVPLRATSSAPEPVVAFVPEPVPVAKPRGPQNEQRIPPLHALVERRDDIVAVEGRRIGRGMVVLDVAESDFLSLCVREFVQAQPAAVQRTLITALSQYITTCDGEGRVVLDRPLGVDSRDRRSRSDVAFTGTLSAQRVDLTLRVAYCGGDSAAPDHIAITADDDPSWTSTRLEFQRDANNCDVAELPYTRTLGRVLLRATDASTAALRFEGTAWSQNLALGDTTRHELRVVLDVIEAMAR
ncbi:MAG: hypothetical protein ABI867_40855 [Kofleriaceae bacterium]